MLAVAHEIGSPLSHAIAILDEGLSGALPSEAFTDAVTSVIDLHDLIDDLLVTARIMSGAIDPPREEMRLDEIVRGLPGVGLVVRSELRYETRPTVVKGSPHLVRRAVSNLVRNAAAHGFRGPGSEIVVRVDEVGVTVQDNGPGVLPDQLARLRKEDGFRARRPQQTGLGLRLTRWVAGVHGGGLVLRNRPEGGFEAQLQFPSASPGSLLARTEGM